MKMASNSTWCRKLTNHAIFDVLRRNNELRDKSLSRVATAKNSSRNRVRNYESVEAQSLLAEKDGQLYVWDSYSSSILTANLKSFAGSQTVREASNQLPLYQELTCTGPPAFHVDSIILNDSSTHLALSGPGGLVVLKLPDARGKFGLFGEGKQQMLCRSTHIDARYFATSGHSLLQAQWHPGSLSNTHIVLLTSDNIIRVYDIMSPDTADHTYHLSMDKLSTNSEAELLGVSNALNVRGALGEVTVSFDFGPAVELERLVLKEDRTESAGASLSAGLTKRVDLAWPIYVLLGNGEVYRLLTSLSSVTSLGQGGRLTGPLQMQPAAEDNYGSDACHIICLSTNPSVIVIATCDAKLHHCVLVDGSSAEDDMLPVGGDMNRSFKNVPEPTLFVYETVELELSLTTISVETQEPIISDFSCPLRLHKDAACLDRYHCLHAAGMHTVVLPWLKELRRFLTSDEAEELDLTRMNPDHQQSIVEHLLCTKPLPSSPPSPMLGICPITDYALGAKVICLTATIQCIVLPLLRSGYSLSGASLLSPESSADITSPLRHLHKESFDSHVSKILRRSASNPILQAGFNSEMSPQECFQLLSRITQVFREEYIMKQNQARAEIEQRIRVLKLQKLQQMSELRDLNISKDVVRRSADRLQEKYGVALKTQATINKRVNAVLRRLQEQMPVLSDAEVGLKNELRQLEVLSEDFKERLQQLKDKKAYNDRVISKPATTEPVRNQSPYSRKGSELNGADILRMKDILREETSDIANLVQRIDALRMHINS